MTFKPGDKKPAGSGRKPGQPNRVTRAMRDEWLVAYEAEGGIEYLRRLARDYPEAFARGLLRMIPNEIAAKIEETTLRIIDLSESREQAPGDLDPVGSAQPIDLRSAPPADLDALAPRVVDVAPPEPEPAPTRSPAWASPWLEEPQDEADFY